MSTLQGARPVTQRSAFSRERPGLHRALQPAMLSEAPPRSVPPANRENGASTGDTGVLYVHGTLPYWALTRAMIMPTAQASIFHDGGHSN